MSKKGAFVYQQIEQATAEWAADTTIYPVSVFLFERLENGKVNMKLTDGVHRFAELPYVMQDVKVAVKQNDVSTYILTVTTAEGEFDTPNLKGPKGDQGIQGETGGTGATGETGPQGIPGVDAPVPSIDPATKHWKIGDEDTGIVAEGQDGATYDDTDIRNALSTLQTQVNALVTGDASAAIESFNEIIAFLANVEDSQTLSGIIAGLNLSISNVQKAIPAKLSQLQNDDNTVKDAAYVHTDNNYSDEEKAKLDDIVNFGTGSNSVTTLVNVPTGKRLVKATLSAASNLSINESARTLNVGEEIYLVCNPTASFTQPIPTTGSFRSMSGSSITTAYGKPFEVSILKIATSGVMYSITVKEQD